MKFVMRIIILYIRLNIKIYITFIAHKSCYIVIHVVHIIMVAKTMIYYLRAVKQKVRLL